MRIDLMKHDILPRLVNYNAIGFLIINRENLSVTAVSNGNFDILDSTRIHPDLYEVAKKMALSALDNEKSDNVVERAMK